MKDRVTPAVADAAGRAESADTRAAGTVREQAEVVSGKVREQPLLAVLIAAGVGYMLGRATRSPMRPFRLARIAAEARGCVCASGCGDRDPGRIRHGRDGVPRRRRRVRSCRRLVLAAASPGRACTRR